MRPPSSWTSAAALIAGVAVSVLLAEAALRVAGITYPVFEMPDAERGVVLRPGKEGWYRKEGEAFVRINRHGYRDAEREVAKPAGTLRIAVLGDSFVEARQVTLEASFPAVLERALADCPSWRGRPVEVLNFGVSGYATTEALLTLRRDALRFSPDLVLLALYPGNDVGENSMLVVQGTGTGWRMPKPIHAFDDSGELVLRAGMDASPWRRLLYTAIHRSRLLEIVNEARRVWEVRRLRTAAARSADPFELGISREVYAPPGDAAWREAWRVTDALLGLMHRTSGDAGAQFMVAVVTMPEQVHPDDARRANVTRQLGVSDLLHPERAIGEIGMRHGFPVIGLAKPLLVAARREGAPLHGFANTVPGTGHWNEAGHRAAGIALAVEICSRWPRT